MPDFPLPTEAPEGQEPDEKTLLAMILAYLEKLLERGKPDPRFLDPREAAENEIRVRPRVEPLGGA